MEPPSLLYRRRRELGVSRRLLALALGIAPSHIARFERGATRLPAGLVARIALALEIDPAEIGVPAPRWVYLPPLPRAQRRRRQPQLLHAPADNEAPR